ncbi:hypothetical protein CYLTODRAFT_443446 [Cylindrobasidium torrendii FP15055 ss-10]|uniref:Uncharacterized protein n=1 Tax=Cylindrobasidium torrendii FP15055 ss-10 TaxID=1314674 RepID=A0A0D7BCU4_9AGAR|nr:hypothetical protein CYLTODRAFT_443446 [Cylindrobasidium torrendii FP15055 ss-10]
MPQNASWFNFILLTVEIHFAVYYFTWKTRNSAYSIAVGLAVLNDVVATIILSAAVWTMYQTHSGSTLDGIPASNYVWTVAINVILVNNTAILEQCFFVHRYFAMCASLLGAHPSQADQRRIPLRASGAPLQYSSIRFSLTRSPRERQCNAPTWLPHTNLLTLPEQHRLFRKIALYCVACGSMTSVATFLNMAFTWFEPAGWIFTIFILGRIYSLSMLVNLVMLRMSTAPRTSIEEVSWTFPAHVHVISGTEPTSTTPGEEFEMRGHVSSISQDDARLGIKYSNKRPRREWPGSDSELDTLEPFLKAYTNVALLDDTRAFGRVPSQQCAVEIDVEREQLER